MCILGEASVKFLKDFFFWIACKRLRFLFFFKLAVSCILKDSLFWDKIYYIYRMFFSFGISVCIVL